VFDLSSEDITEGPLSRALVVLAAPLVAQNLVRVGQGLVNLFWLGRYSSEAVAAVGLATPIVGLLLAAVTYAPSIGTQIVVAQRVGADDTAGTHRVLVAGLLVGLTTGVVGGVSMYLGADSLMALFASIHTRDIDSAVLGLSAVYLTIVALGTVVSTLGDVAEGALVGWGDSRKTLYINVATVVTDVLLTPVFVFGWGTVPELGVAGAAIATVAGYVAGFAITAVYLRTRVEFATLSARVGDVTLDEVREVLDVGLPVAGQRVLRQIASVLFISVVFLAGGGAGLAAYVVGVRISKLAFLPARALQQAAQSVVGQNLGASHPDRANRTTLVGIAIAAGGLTVFGALQWLAPGVIVDVFGPELSPEATAFTVTFLKLLALSYPAAGAMFLLEAGFNGASRSRASLGGAIVRSWVVQLPVAVAGTLLGYGVVAVFAAVALANVAVAILLAAYYVYSLRNRMFVVAMERATDAG
jgi:putative MATE family efflux protein